MIHHPDRGGDKHKFNQLNDAYTKIKTKLSHQYPPTKNKNVITSIDITIEDVYTGGERDIYVTMPNNHSEWIRINLPKGVSDGDRLCFKGCGDTEISTLTAGDLYVNITVVNHEKFIRDGDDCMCTIPLSLKYALLGGSTTIELPDGRHRTLEIPSGTQQYSTMVLENEGFFNNSDCTYGDFIVMLYFEIPSISNPDTKVSDL
jgi:DnaJ-class molecular chaperone